MARSWCTMALALLLSFLLLGAYTGCSAPSGPWDAFNFAPESRTIYPRAVWGTHGNVTNAENVLSDGSLTLSGNGSYVALDFGYEVTSPYPPSTSYLSVAQSYIGSRHHLIGLW